MLIRIPGNKVISRLHPYITVSHNLNLRKNAWDEGCSLSTFKFPTRLLCPAEYSDMFYLLSVVGKVEREMSGRLENNELHVRGN